MSLLVLLRNGVPDHISKVIFSFFPICVCGYEWKNTYVRKENAILLRTNGMVRREAERKRRGKCIEERAEDDLSHKMLNKKFTQFSFLSKDLLEHVSNANFNGGN